ncbi:hypothetical protein [uncultured Nostoc sp.]|uniref:hypothetical protein n=1 Tax=uncultured Nostoc sp. TaxID=340711 RepID=UPI0035CC2CC2
MKVTSFSTQTSPMNSIDFGTLLTTIFVIVDDWYQKQVKKTTLIKPGVKARGATRFGEVGSKTSDR